MILPTRVVMDHVVAKFGEGDFTYSCNAIEYVAMIDFDINADTVLGYTTTYKEFTWCAWGCQPYWWGSGSSYTAERLEALKAFRDSL